MGDSVEQWRATSGQWSGGRPRNCVILQHHIAQTSNHIGYMQIKFLVLVSLLVISCVKLNPGPDHVKYVILSNKYLCMCEGFCRENYTVQMEEETANNNLPKIIM